MSRATTTIRWTVSVMGTTNVSRGSRAVDLRPKERAVVAAIALANPHPIDTDRIATLIWEHSPPASAHKSIHNHIARVRRAAEGLIATSSEGYRFGDHVGIDLHQPSSADSVPFADLPNTPEVLGHRQRIQALVASHEDAELEAAVAHRVDPQLIDRLHAAVLVDPYRERRWYLLTAAQARLGWRRDALLTYESARQHLAEVGLAPGTALRELAARILDDRDHDRIDGLDADLHAGHHVGARLACARPERHPVPFHPHHADPFVGRTDEIARLSRAWSAVVEQRSPQFVVIEGPAGIGKTRLADRFCTSLDGAARVMWGRSRGTTDRPYGAIVDAIARILDEEPELIDALGPDASGLWTLLPARSPRTDPADATVEALARTHVSVAVAALVRQLASIPTLWLIDDLQWASPDTIALVEEALDSLDGPVMVVATRRRVGGDIDASLASLTRLIETTTIDLGALSVDDISELIEQSVAVEERADPAIARMVHDRTAGLPLYASELARAARLTGDPIDAATVPTAIRDWVTHRIGALDRPSIEILQLGSVIGQRFDPWLLTRCLPGRAADQIAQRCDELVRRGLFGDSSGEATLEFSHAITRDIVYEGIGTIERARLHERVARAMEDSGAAEVDDLDHAALDHAVLAHHYLQGGPDVRHLAARHAAIAGRDSLAVGAWARAAEMFETVLLLARSPGARANALVELGTAQLCAEDFAAAIESLQEAVVIARSEGLAVVQATATLALVGRAGRGAALEAGDAAQVAMLRSAIDGLERSPTPLPRNDDWSVLMSDLERELAFSLLLADAQAERQQLLTTSLARVRSLDTPRPAAVAKAIIGGRYGKLAPELLGVRLDDLDEVLAMPPVDLGPEVLLAAHCYQFEDLLRSSQFERAGDTLDTADVIARGYSHPYWSWALRTWRGLAQVIDGDLDAAERTAIEAFELRSSIAEAQACLGVNLVNIRLYQGRSAEMIETLSAAVRDHPEIPAYRAVLALCAYEVGAIATAREILHWFSEAGFDNLPADTSRFLGLAVLAHVAADLEDQAAGRQLDHLLMPYRDQWVVVSCYGGGGASWGPANHALAKLAALDGRLGEAELLFERAAEQAEGSPLASARIADDRARLTETVG